MIWDQGTWTPDFDPAFGYKKGHLKFHLTGKKLKGQWHLVRMKPKPREKNENWLLFKSDDEAARPADAPDITRREAATRRRPAAASRRSAASRIACGRRATGEITEPKKKRRRKIRRSMPQRSPRPSAAPMPGFIEPSLADGDRDRARRARTGCTRSSMTAIACRPISRTAG